MTRHANVTRESRVTTPVSHATHTTPHHTLSLAEVGAGSSWANESIHRFGSRGLGLEKRMGGYAAKIRGVR